MKTQKWLELSLSAMLLVVAQSMSVLADDSLPAEDQFAKNVTNLPGDAKGGIGVGNPDAISGKTSPDAKMSGDLTAGEAGITDAIKVAELVERAKFELERAKANLALRKCSEVAKNLEAGRRIIKDNILAADVLPKPRFVLDEIQRVELQNLETWATELEKEAKDVKDAEQYRDAREKLRALLAIKDSNLSVEKRDEIELKIKQLDVAYEKQKTMDAIRLTGRELYDVDREIDQLYREAQFLYGKERYTEARDKIEQIMVKNPYDEKAIRLMVNISKAQQRIGKTVKDKVFIDMMTVQGWRWAVPSTPTLANFDINEEKNAQIIPDDATAIRTKLESIVIPDVKFDKETTMLEIVKFLKKASKDYDPDGGQGINFLIANYPALKAKTPARGAADGWGAGAGPSGVGPGAMAPGAVDEWGNPVAGAAPGGGAAAAAAPAAVTLLDDEPINTDFSGAELPLQYVLKKVVEFYRGGINYEIDRYTVTFYRPENKPVNFEEREWEVAPNFFNLEENTNNSNGNNSNNNNNSSMGGGMSGGMGGGLGGGSSNGLGGSSNNGSSSGSSESNKIVYTQEPLDHLEAEGIIFREEPPETPGGAAPGGAAGGDTATANANRKFLVDSQGKKAQVSYNINSRILRVNNTREMLDKIDHLINARINRNLVTIEAKFIEVKQIDENALSFDWSLKNGWIYYDPSGNNFTNTNPTPAAGTTPFTSTGSLQGGSFGLGEAMSSLTAGLRKSVGEGTPPPALADVWGIFGGTAFNMILSAISQTAETNVLFAPRVTCRDATWAQLTSQSTVNFLDISIGGQSQTTSTANVGTTTTGPTVTVNAVSIPESVTLWVRPIVQSDKYTIDLQLLPNVTMFSGVDRLEVDMIVNGQRTQYAVTKPRITTRSVSGGTDRTNGPMGGGMMGGMNGMSGGMNGMSGMGGMGNSGYGGSSMGGMSGYGGSSMGGMSGYGGSSMGGGYGGSSMGGGYGGSSMGGMNGMSGGMNGMSGMGGMGGGMGGGTGVNVSIWDGESVVLGGMISERISKFHDKVPFLGDIPFIGRLFQGRGERAEKFNLLIFVTARIVNPAGIPIRPHQLRGIPDFNY